MPVLACTKVDKNYRTTVPREVRELLEICDGETIEWVYEDGCIYVRES